MMNQMEWVKIISYFLVYSFAGWVMESILKTILQKKPVNSGFLYGPICPIYGFGAMIMLGFLQNFKNNGILLFLSGFFILSIWEYIVGWLLEKLFKTKYWDYTENRFNIKGRVCLMNSIFWGILGVVFIYYIHPFVEEKIAIIPEQHLLFLTALCVIIFIIDIIISVIKVNTIGATLEKLKELSNNLKEKLEEIEAKPNLENIQEKIEELKNKQRKIKQRLIRQTDRLKRAFPTMKSELVEKINEIVYQKKDDNKKR